MGKGKRDQSKERSKDGEMKKMKAATAEEKSERPPRPT